MCIPFCDGTSDHLRRCRRPLAGRLVPLQPARDPSRRADAHLFQVRGDERGNYSQISKIAPGMGRHMLDHAAPLGLAIRPISGLTPNTYETYVGALDAVRLVLRCAVFWSVPLHDLLPLPAANHARPGRRLA